VLDEAGCGLFLCHLNPAALLNAELMKENLVTHLGVFQNLLPGKHFEVQVAGMAGSTHPTSINLMANKKQKYSAALRREMSARIRNDTSASQR
jgi:hypothetical protein